MALATSLYAVFAVYPFVLGNPGARIPRSVPHGDWRQRLLLLRGPDGAAAGRAVLDRRHRPGRSRASSWPCCCARCSASSRKADATSRRLAIVAGSALAFATVAIPLQLEQQWITIGWALEGAALAWLYRRIPHRGLLYCGDGAAVGRLRPARAESRDLHLRAARHARLQLVSLRVSDLQRRDPCRRVVAVAHRRSAARRSATGPRRPRCCRRRA